MSIKGRPRKTSPTDKEISNVKDVDDSKYYSRNELRLIALSRGLALKHNSKIFQIREALNMRPVVVKSHNSKREWVSKTNLDTGETTVYESINEMARSLGYTGSGSITPSMNDKTKIVRRGGFRYTLLRLGRGDIK